MIDATQKETLPTSHSLGSDEIVNEMMIDPVCVVGMACRLPGSIKSPSGLWDFLLNKKSAQGPVPEGRFRVKGFCDASGNRAGVVNAAGGYFLDEDVRDFENSFFGINNLEATSMDPQQRKLLEVVYECFENAGESLERISGSNTGVYVGNFTIDHQIMQTRDPDFIHRYTATGCGTTILSNRISHVFNLQGPSLTIDTACSSSIYCLHNAVTAIQAGDCDGAIIAGVNLIMAPEQWLGTSKAGVISPTSTCHTFDASADGYGRGEGVNAVYVKRLSTAIKDGDKVWAVIRGTAVNANGRTPGITQPSADLQEVVIRKAYARAGLDFAETDYVECHGTGTPVGDPIEIDAIDRCFSRAGKENSLLIGSSKTSLGHSEAASGLTAMIKVILAFEHAKIPPTQGLRDLNPKLRLGERNMQVVTNEQDWPGHIRRASINAFGYGGANAHAILECPISYQNTIRGVSRHLINGHEITKGLNGTYEDDYVDVVGSQSNTGPNGTHVSDEINILDSKRDAGADHVGTYEIERLVVLPISASSMQSLDARTEDVRNILKSGNSKTLRSLANSLAHRSTHFNYRHCLVLRSNQNIGSAQEESAVHLDGFARTPGPSTIAFVFTGQGAQYATMAKELVLGNHTFRATIRSLDKSLRTLPSDLAPNWTLEQTLLDPEEVSRIHDVTRSQPICTAIQIAIVDMLYDSGVVPDGGVIGHSSGEIAAAYAARLLTRTQAILVAYFRGYAVGKLQSQGAMMAAGLSFQEAETLLVEKGLGGQVCVACVNSPTSVTLSGTSAGIDMLLEEIQVTRKGFARKLQTGGRAYHSYMMKEIGSLYEDLISPLFSQGKENAIEDSMAKFAMISSVGRHGEKPTLVVNDTRWPRYWRNNLEMPVQFVSALEKLAANNKKLHLIEIGPHSALKGPIKQIRTHLKRDEQSLLYSSSLTRNDDADICMKRLFGTLWVYGHGLQWQNVNSDSVLEPHVPHLSPYPWDYSAGLLWQEPRMSTEIRNRAHTRHELLGSKNVAGDGVKWSWRNVLRLNEVPWLRDHRIEAQIVFPAAAYLAVAIEALKQIRPEFEKGFSFHFRNVGINAALVIPNDQEGDKTEVELHTNMSPKELSTTTSSSDWYEFTMSSIASTTTVHCSGSVRVLPIDSHENSGLKRAVTIHSAAGFETWPTLSRWYAKFKDGGLSFGPSFQSVSELKTSGERHRREAVCTTPLNPLPNETTYPVHPILIDACLQAGIMSTTAGDLSALRGFMPVFIEECQIRPTSRHGPQDLAAIYARSRKTGLSTQRIDCTLVGPDSTPIVDLHQVRMSQYTAKLASEPEMTRQPCLRVQWKPDIQLLREDGAELLTKYLGNLVNKLEQADVELAGSKSFPTIAGLLDLFGHKNPRMRVLELDNESACGTKPWPSLLGADTGFQRYGCWKTGKLNEQGVFALDNLDSSENCFDVVLISKETSSMVDWQSFSDLLLPLVTVEGAFIIHRSDEALAALHQAQLKVLNIGSQVLLAFRPSVKPIDGTFKTIVPSLKGQVITILIPAVAEATHTYRCADALAGYLRNYTAAESVNIVAFDQSICAVQAWKDTICISLLEMENEFLATISQNNMDLLHRVTDEARTLLWITGAGMLGDTPNPSLTLSSGLSRALMLEQPTLQFAVLDVGFVSDEEALCTCQNILTTIEILLSDSETKDKEFIQANGLLHISRFSPDFDLNSLFRRRIAMDNQGQSAYAIQEEVISSARPAHLAIGSVGLSETIHFQQIRESPTSPPEGYIDVLVRGVSLNAKDVYALNGRVETRDATLAMEFSGVVTAMGPGVTHVREGDRVVVLAPCCFSTTERVPGWAAHKILPEEEFTIMPTLPLIYCTALFALRDRGHLRAGESVLIHSGSGAFGLAAIAIAKRIGATIYTTAGSAEKRTFVATETGIPESHVFHSRDSSFVAALKQATNGRGVDLVVNSLVADLMHASWSCIAPFGRFVEIGKRELVDAGKLDMHVFLRNATFSAFDLTDLYFGDTYQRDVLRSMVAEVLQMYRSGEIAPVPTTCFSVSQIVQAYRFFSSKDRIGKVAISLEDDQVQIPVAPAKYRTTFDPKKVYLLVGCLGGLGRSLTRWMMTRGARNFVMLGRSGCDKPSARDLVDRLIRAHANVTVIRGDVSVASSVFEAVSACTATGRQIGGVVQAAMGLHEGLFSSMTSEAWQEAVRPKYVGSFNLHEALKGHDEDFFVMTSSVSGSLGTATESNYCAANGFLDAFARWRRTQGKPAVSVGLGMISEVGYLHENPDIEALLLRRGVQPLSESEFLQVVDMALAGDQTSTSHEAPWSAHILTGLETSFMRQLMERGFDVGSQTLEDPRAAILSAALDAETKRNRETQNGVDEVGRSQDVADWFHTVPLKASKVLRPEAQSPSLQFAILQLVRKRFSNLILMPIDQIADDKPLAGFGVDSMIASEFRSWFWTTFGVDVPFLDLLSPEKTLFGLSEFTSVRIMSDSGEAR